MFKYFFYFHFIKTQSVEETKPPKRRAGHSAWFTQCLSPPENETCSQNFQVLKLRGSRNLRVEIFLAFVMHNGVKCKLPGKLLMAAAKWRTVV